MKEQIVVYKCDRCKQAMPVPVSFGVHVGYVCGAVSQEDDVKRIDLCALCASIALQRLANSAPTFSHAQSFIDTVLNRAVLLRHETRI